MIKKPSLVVALGLLLLFVSYLLVTALIALAIGIEVASIFGYGIAMVLGIATVITVFELGYSLVFDKIGPILLVFSIPMILVASAVSRDGTIAFMKSLLARILDTVRMPIYIVK